MPEPNQAQLAAEFARWRAESGHYLPGTYLPFEAGFRAGWAARATAENDETPQDADSDRAA